MRDVAEKANVSTRTLYNRYADILSLFVACLDSGATDFPRPVLAAGEDVALVLRRYAAAIASALSSDIKIRISMVVYSEGSEFPELLRAAEANRDEYVVNPLAAYLREAGLGRGNAHRTAKLFLVMALSEWQERTMFHLPLQRKKEFKQHAEAVVDLFLHGCKPASHLAPPRVSALKRVK